MEWISLETPLDITREIRTPYRWDRPLEQWTIVRYSKNSAECTDAKSLELSDIKQLGNDHCAIYTRLPSLTPSQREDACHDVVVSATRPNDASIYIFGMLVAITAAAACSSTFRSLLTLSRAP